MIFWAHLKVSFRPTAVTDSAVSAESVAFTTWCKESEKNVFSNPPVQVSVCGQTTEPHTAQNIFLSNFTYNQQRREVWCVRGLIWNSATELQ